MDVHIKEVVSNVSLDTGPSPRTLEKITRTVLMAMRAEKADDARRKKDRRITNGARDEQEGEA